MMEMRSFAWVEGKSDFNELMSALAGLSHSIALDLYSADLDNL